ncbi:2-amino-4-hydroxy-6-hydroxymethyldihydropteridine diphosphokinase [Synergistales bacterium]|nr:2-amino-4-hydroxy-6-hydroxymethyldihydropteridine diphosphokinase [Synergistales bacterium]
MRAVLGLGANLGNRLTNLRAAVHHLKEIIHIVAKSDVFETEPWGVRDQPRFLNACVLVEPKGERLFEPEKLLSIVKDIEKRMGRKDSRRWGERVIDIDILLMDSLTCESEILKIPHPHMRERLFVLTPLSQILPDWKEDARRLAEKETGRQPLRICHL